MATKPKGVYVIASQSPGSNRQVEGQPPTTLNAWYVPLEQGETLAEATERAYKDFGISQRITVISDSNATTYDVAATLREVTADAPHIGVPDPGGT